MVIDRQLVPGDLQDKFRRHKLNKRYLTTLFLLLLLSGTGSLFGFKDVPDNPEAVQPLLPGMQAPPAVFTNPDGTSFDLLKETAEKPVILIFYRGGW